jgi:acyl-CoA oxidase
MVCTTATVDGIEELRRACGGHGFSDFSGLPAIYGNAMVNYTGEGEAYMIIQQTTRWLLKQHAAAAAGAGTGAGVDLSDAEGKSNENTAFIKCGPGELEGRRWRGVSDDAILDGAVQLEAFEHRAARLLDATSQSIAAATATGGMSAADAVHLCQWQGIQASIAFGEMLMVRSLIRGVAAAPASCRGVLLRVQYVYILSLLQRRVGDFVVDGFVSASQLGAIDRLLKELLPMVRVEAVALLECFGHHVRCFSFSNRAACSRVLGLLSDPTSEA